ncbi:MAG TPA: type II toxin-antitoxin system Phd/YefM family antitoxin [Chloroflexi bacterium]|nr:type II toxin-antitoxin system Phd/YefM family antitoxin [Chloroflexota bacterium]
MSTRIMPVSDLRRQMSSAIKMLQQQDDAVYITQHGRPQAVLLSYDHYEQLLEQSREQTASAADLETIRNDPELIALTEWIRATPPNPAAIHPATDSLAELLQNAPEDSNFDLETWTRQWETIEAEMKAIDRSDDIAEGRG